MVEWSRGDCFRGWEVAVCCEGVGRLVQMLCFFFPSANLSLPRSLRALSLSLSLSPSSSSSSSSLSLPVSLSVSAPLPPPVQALSFRCDILYSLYQHVFFMCVCAWARTCVCVCVAAYLCVCVCVSVSVCVSVRERERVCGARYAAYVSVRKNRRLP